MTSEYKEVKTEVNGGIKKEEKVDGNDSSDNDLDDL